MNPNETLFDGQVRRRIAIERYSSARARKALEFLEEVRRDVVAKLASEKLGKYSARQQREFLRSVDTLHNEIYGRLNDQLDSDFKRLAAEQAAFEAKSLRAATGLTVKEISATKAFEVATARPMEGRFLKDWLKELEPAHRRRLDAALRISFVEGETLREATRRIGRVVDMSGNGLRTLIRTANSHISSVVSGASYMANQDIIEEYEWRSTLDSRTTPICQTRDGQRYKVGDGPLPPAHPGCRSTTTPILKGHPPPKRVTYSEWIERQPADVQDDILGKARGDALRRGSKVKDFVDSTGRLKPLVKRPRRPAPPPAPPRKPLHPTAMAEPSFEALLDNAFKEAPDWGKKAIKASKAAQSRGHGGKGAYYLPADNSVHMPKHYSPKGAKSVTGEAVMRHEYGHAVDFRGSITDPLSARLKSEAMADAAIMREKTGRATLRNLTDSEAALAKALSPAEKVEPYIRRAIRTGSMDDVYEVARQTVYAGAGETATGYDWMLLLDMIQGVSKGEYGAGHSLAYLRGSQRLGDGYTVNMLTEAFANVFALETGPRAKLWRQMLELIAPKFSRGVRTLIAEEIKK
jgi:SPP1 gp7 family putative phage head morphogenesis protein